MLEESLPVIMNMSRMKSAKWNLLPFRALSIGSLLLLWMLLKLLQLFRCVIEATRSSALMAQPQAKRAHQHFPVTSAGDNDLCVQDVWSEHSVK